MGGVRQMTEEDRIQSAVIEHWECLGLPDTLVAAIPNKRAFGQPGLTPGLHDLIVFAPNFLGLLELKTATGRLSGPQREIHELCERNQIPSRVAHGRDEPIKILEDWNIVRRQAA